MSEDNKEPCTSFYFCKDCGSLEIRWIEYSSVKTLVKQDYDGDIISEEEIKNDITDEGSFDCIECGSTNIGHYEDGDIV